MDCKNCRAFQRDKERYLSVQYGVDMKQRRLKQEVKDLQRANDMLRDRVKELENDHEPK